jgi:hypothetical protein
MIAALRWFRASSLGRRSIALEIPLHLHELVLLFVAVEVVVYGIAANLFFFAIVVTLLPAPLFVLRLALIPLVGELPAPD